jgi:hypothetical protein
MTDDDIPEIDNARRGLQGFARARKVTTAGNGAARSVAI